MSSHFDAGCKTPGCTSKLAPGEPDLCAYVGPLLPKMPTHTGEPFCFHILNRYFDEFIPRGIALGKQSHGSDTPYTYMIQPWIASLYLDCPNAGIAAWPGIGDTPGRPLLHCPNVTEVAAFKAALISGDMFLHGFATNAEASYYPDASVFEAALSVAQQVAAAAGIAPPTAISQRDVPGWTRATLPLLCKHNIEGLSFGAGTPPGKADVPPLFVWRDEASGCEVVTTYETAYGTDHQVFVLPNGEALVAQWESDNQGPGSYETVQGFYSYLRQQFPGAAVAASTFDRFFAAAAQFKSQLPVVTQEIEDGWIYGVPSDPLKNAQFREVCRQRKACLESGACDVAELEAFDRFLVKVPEHTWGVAQAWFLPDYTNWTNAQFDLARAQQPLGFVRNNTVHADYNTTVNSWLEQRLFVSEAPRLLQSKYPALATNMSAALEALRRVQAPSTTGFQPVPEPFDRVFSCGQTSLQFNDHGALSQLKILGSDWASPARPIGQLLYQTFTNEDYNVFLDDFAVRLGDQGIWPNHTESHSDCRYTPGQADNMNCGNFRRPNMTSAKPVHRSLSPTLVALWYRQSGEPGRCTFIAQANFPAEPQANAGAPQSLFTTISIAQTRLSFDVVWLEKRPTRLAESFFFTFNPDVSSDGWFLDVLGSRVNATDVVALKGGTDLDSVYGGSPHLRGAEAVTWKGDQGQVRLTSLDVPIVCVGKPTPFTTPRNEPPDMAFGVHFNLYQNIWNTNYILWYPYLDDDKNSRFRFEMDIV
eukprot:gene6387-1139_t